MERQNVVMSGIFKLHEHRSFFFWGQFFFTHKCWVGVDRLLYFLLVRRVQVPMGIAVGVRVEFNAPTSCK